MLIFQPLTDSWIDLYLIAIASMTLSFQIIHVAHPHMPLPGWYLSAVTAFFFVSLGANALDTGLIVFKIINVYHDIRRLHPTNSRSGSAYESGQRVLYPLISILVESGLITFVAQLAQSIMYKFANAAFPLVAGVVVMLYVRTFHVFDFGVSNFFIYYLSTTHREFR